MFNSATFSLLITCQQGLHFPFHLWFSWCLVFVSHSFCSWCNFFLVPFPLRCLYFSPMLIITLFFHPCFYPEKLRQSIDFKKFIVLFFDVAHLKKIFIEFLAILLLSFVHFGSVWFFGQEACGTLAPWPGIEPTPPALGGEVLTTGQPGKTPKHWF